MSAVDWDDRFHRAAKDDNLDLLAKANRKDANTKDEDGMTPTLWAAYYGNLAALRKIIERGGKPDKCDYLGNTSLHCAASRGHYNCVSYLVNFGCNLWAMDNSHRTAMDLASINDRQDIVKLLDQARANEQAKNPKLVRKNQENAVLEADARIKDFDKRQRKLQDRMKVEESTSRRQTVISSGSKPSGFYKTVTSKFQSTTSKNCDEENTASHLPIMTSRTGEALLVQKKLGKKPTDDTSSLASDMTFKTDSGYGDDDHSVKFPLRSGLPGFDRAFLTKMRPLQAADLYGLDSSAGARRRIAEEAEEEFDTPANPATGSRSDSALDSVGSGGSYARHDEWQHDLSEDDDEDDEEQDLKMFLAGNGLGEFYPLFQKEEVGDMQTLLLLTETDLEKIGLGLGPRKRLMQAILRFRADIDDHDPHVPAEVHDSRL